MGRPYWKSSRGTMKVFWVPFFLVQMEGLVFSQPQQPIKPIKPAVGTGGGAIAISQPIYIPPCYTTEKCMNAFPGSGVKGFCSNGQLGPIFNCLPGDGIGQSYCNFKSCSCCKECMDRTCSKRRTPCRKDLAFLTSLAASLLGLRSKELVPVA